MKQTNKEYEMDLESCFKKATPEENHLVKDFTGNILYNTEGWF